VDISILGAGSWASSLADVLIDNEHNVLLWHYKKNTKNNPNITNSLECIQKRMVIFIALPSHAISNILERINPKPEALIVVCSKGFDPKTKCRLSLIVEQKLAIKKNNIIILSGPSHAEEVSRKVPTAVVAASSSLINAEYIQNIISNHYFRVYTSTDVIGIEIAAAAKNIIAIASGICIGLNYGDNTIAALISRGLKEVIRLGKKFKAKEDTFYGLGGLGDLSVTAFSKHSRNRKFGINIVKYKNLNKAQNEIKMIVEGINATEIIYKLSKKYKINMPIVNQVYSILFENKDAKSAINELMNRKLIPESTNI
jgi:glycerol-3-phosphate dehydrogenase (NAD(P)+)|tara:strand:- start:97 stop:1035 length:939 start_codon:yes stop_codon:yes gene_type:complete